MTSVNKYNYINLLRDSDFADVSKLGISLVDGVLVVPNEHIVSSNNFNFSQSFLCQS